MSNVLPGHYELKRNDCRLMLCGILDRSSAKQSSSSIKSVIGNVTMPSSTKSLSSGPVGYASRRIFALLCSSNTVFGLDNVDMSRFAEKGTSSMRKRDESGGEKNWELARGESNLLEISQ